MKFSAIKNTTRHHMWIEMGIISALILGLNAHLVFQSLGNGLMYSPDITGVNGFFRLLFHPFVHVSAYHLFLDAGAFALLYFGLNTVRMLDKALYVTIPAIFSFVFVSLFCAEEIANGFCGLSGIAHGLMVVYGLEMILSGKSKKAALIVMSMVVLKTLYEMISGHPLFSSMHLGQIGQPIPASHAGGVIGGFMGFAIVHKRTQGA